MTSIEFEITNNILEYTGEKEAVYSALLHWRWSQIERTRRSLVRTEFKGLEVSNTEEYSILVFINLHPSPSSTEIASYLKMEKSTISEFIKRSVAKKMIQEFPDHTDKRRIYYKLTREGKKTLDHANKKMALINQRLFAALSAEERQDLLGLLLTLNKQDKI